MGGLGHHPKGTVVDGSEIRGEFPTWHGAETL